MLRLDNLQPRLHCSTYLIVLLGNGARRRSFVPYRLEVILFLGRVGTAITSAKRLESLVLFAICTYSALITHELMDSQDSNGLLNEQFIILIMVMVIITTTLNAVYVKTVSKVQRLVRT